MVKPLAAMGLQRDGVLLEEHALTHSNALQVVNKTVPTSKLVNTTPSTKPARTSRAETNPTANSEKADLPAEFKDRESKIQDVLTKAKALHEAMDFMGSLAVLVESAKEFPELSAAVEDYREGLVELTKGFEKEREDAEKSGNLKKQIIQLSAQLRVYEALEEDEKIKELSAKFVPLMKHLSLANFQEKIEGLAEFIAEQDLKLAKAHVSVNEEAKGKPHLVFQTSFAELTDDKKLRVLEELGQAAVIGQNRQAAAQAKEKAAQLRHQVELNSAKKQELERQANLEESKVQYYEGKVALLEGNLSKAQVQFREFKASAGKISDSEIIAMAEEAGELLVGLGLEGMKVLHQENEALLAQRKAHLSLGSMARFCADNQILLETLTDLIESGAATTSEEALAQLKEENQRRHQSFKQSFQALEEFYQKNSNDLSLYHPDSFPELTMRADAKAKHLDLRETPHAPLFRILLDKGAWSFTDKNGRLIRGFNKEAKVVFIKDGCLEVPSDWALNRDYRETANLNPPTDSQEKLHVQRRNPSVQPGTYDELLEQDSLLAYAEDLKNRDPVFEQMLQWEHPTAVIKRQNSETMRESLLQKAKALRSAEGSYQRAGEILRGLFQKEFAAALQEITKERPLAVQRMREEAGQDEPEIEKKVGRKSKILKKKTQKLLRKFIRKEEVRLRFNSE